MRRLLVILLIALVAVPTASASPIFVFTGHGWGHGIGMPQYGAQGYASKADKTYDWILAHYYPGTKLAPSPVASVRVLVADGRSQLTIGSAAAFTAKDATGKTVQIPKGSVTFGPGLKITVAGKEHDLAGPVRFTRGTKNLTVGGKAYRGAFVVRSSGGRLSVVNEVGLDQYVYGVVPNEMPSSWAPEALKAQAVAARSYGLASRSTGGTFDLYPDTRSQVYGGVASEDARTTAAVDATAGQILTYGGKVIAAYFHSTSGGRTAFVQDIWGGSPVPYLVSVADPYDSLSPYHNWGPFRYTARALKGRLGGSAPRGSLLDALVNRNPSLRVKNVKFIGGSGTSTVSGSLLQSRLGLRSTWFSIGVLSLKGPAKITYGGTATLHGLARGFDKAWLERRTAKGLWQQVGRVKDAKGPVAFTQSPTVTTTYRIATARAKGPSAKVGVAPAVTLAVRQQRHVLAGVVTPKRAGIVVQLQRLVDGRWKTIARDETDAAGRFRARLAVKPGTYRALAAPGGGLVPGTSEPLTVGA
jgi:stage II sporulation protein D